MPADSSAVVASAQAMTMDEALKHVTISTEDWLDGNTYYIRYTFTNPTNVAINKKVDLTVVSYQRCSIINDDATIIYDSPDKKDTLPWTEQCSNMIRPSYTIRYGLTYRPPTESYSPSLPQHA